VTNEAKRCDTVVTGIVGLAERLVPRVGLTGTGNDALWAMLQSTTHANLLAAAVVARALIYSADRREG
jgi:hypothetical protein